MFIFGKSLLSALILFAAIAPGPAGALTHGGNDSFKLLLDASSQRVLYALEIAPTHVPKVTLASDTVASVIRVNNGAELKSALNAARGGEVIELATGVQFGHLDIRRVDFDSPVTIRSAEGDAPARFWSIAVIDSSNVVIEDVMFKYVFKLHHAGNAGFAPFNIAGSDNVTLRGVTFEGDDATGIGGIIEGLPFGMGLRVRNSTSITIENSLVMTFWKGLLFDNVTGVVVRGNEITDIRSDGINVPKTRDVLIEDNHIHNFRGTSDWSDHRDMIQFWGTDGFATQDLTIRGNVLDIGNGSYTQSIYASTANYDPNNPVHMFRNIVIEDNLIANNHFHGISLGVTDGLVVRDNTLMMKVGHEGGPGGGDIPLINLDSRSTDVVLMGNVTPQKIYEGNGSWATGDNAVIHPRLYNDNFSGLDGPAIDMTLVPGGPVDRLGLGSSQLEAPAASGSAAPEHDKTSVPGAPSAR